MANYEKVMNMSIDDMVERYYDHSRQLRNVMATLAFMYQTFHSDDYKNAYNRCNLVLNTILSYKA